MRGKRSPHNQSTILDMLHSAGWVDDGESAPISYKIITMESYPLPGAIINPNMLGRPRLRRSSWKVTVGRYTTYFYEPVRGKKFHEWRGYHYNNSDIAGITRQIAVLE